MRVRACVCACVCVCLCVCVSVYISNLCYKSASQSLHHVFPTLWPPGCTMRPVATLEKCVYITKISHKFRRFFCTTCYFFTCGPQTGSQYWVCPFAIKWLEVQNSQMSVTGCRGPDIDVGLCMHSYVSLFRSASFPFIYRVCNLV